MFERSERKLENISLINWRNGEIGSCYVASKHKSAFKKCIKIYANWIRQKTHKKSAGKKPSHFFPLAYMSGFYNFIRSANQITLEINYSVVIGYKLWAINPVASSYYAKNYLFMKNVSISEFSCELILVWIESVSLKLYLNLWLEDLEVMIRVLCVLPGICVEFQSQWLFRCQIW